MESISLFNDDVSIKKIKERYPIIPNAFTFSPVSVNVQKKKKKKTENLDVKNHYQVNHSIPATILKQSVHSYLTILTQSFFS